MSSLKRTIRRNVNQNFTDTDFLNRMIKNSKSKKKSNSKSSEKR